MKKKKIVKNKAPKGEVQVMVDCAAAKPQEPEMVKACMPFTTRELRQMYSYVWQSMVDKLIDFGPKTAADLTPEEFMKSCVYAADFYIRNLWDNHHEY